MKTALKGQHALLRQCPFPQPSYEYQVTSFVVEYSTSEEFTNDTITATDGKASSFLSDRRMDNGTTLSMFEADVTGLQVRIDWTIGENGMRFNVVTAIRSQASYLYSRAIGVKRPTIGVQHPVQYCTVLYLFLAELYLADGVPQLLQSSIASTIATEEVPNHCIVNPISFH